MKEQKILRIRNSAYVYGNFSQMFELLKFKNTSENYYEVPYKDIGNQFVVFAKTSHIYDYYTEVLALRNVFNPNIEVLIENKPEDKEE